MKLTRNSYNLLIRFLAGLAAALLLAGGVALSGGMSGGRSTQGLYYQVSGLHPDGVIMTVNNSKITAEEYLYWINYFCDYNSSYLSYMGITDLDGELSQGMTAGQYIAQQSREQAEAMVIQNAVIKGWAEEVGITLTEEDLADMADQRAEAVASLGGEEAFTAYLKNLGITEDLITEITSYGYLVQHLSDLYIAPGGALRPSDEELLAEAAEHGVTTARILVISNEADTSATELARQYADRIAQAENLEAEFDAVAEELGQAPDFTLYHSHDEDDALSAALLALEDGQFTGVVESGDVCYLAIRTPMDMDGLANLVFNEAAEARIENAVVSYNDELLNALDVEGFYKSLVAARTADANGQ